MTTIMEGETSWESHAFGCLAPQAADYEAIFDACCGIEEEVSLVSLEALLPDDILERIFSYMPIACLMRMASVCRRWYEVVHSRRRFSSLSCNSPQKPWYFMFTGGNSAEGHAYDPSLRKWHGGVTLPYMASRNWSVSSSSGLVCYMDKDCRSTIFISNPITRDCKRIQGPPDGDVPDYCALAVSSSPGRRSHSFTLALVKSKQVPGDFLQWEFSIHVYDSSTTSWKTSAREVLVGWRGGDEGVICNGVLYFLIYATGIVGNADRRHCLVMFDLSAAPPSHPAASIMRESTAVPCSLTCGRLINMKDRLVMVGGIGKPDRADIIKGIGIWELRGRGGDWREVTRMPQRFFQGFGELDDVFASGGAGDLVFIQSYGAPALLVYDMSQRQWRWSTKCPVSKRLPLQLFTGFCFEPRLEVAP